MLLKIYKGILLVYFVNVFLTTLMIIAGLRPTGLIAAIFQYYDFANQVRPQGFASEPSYAAIIIVFSLLGILKITDFKIVKTNFKWYLMAIASIIMTQSSYGLIMIFIIVVYILNKEKKQLFKSKFFLGFVILLIPLGIYLLVYSNLNSITRLATIFQYVYDGNNISNSLVTLSEVDGSASFRVLPSIQMIEYYKTAPLSSILFGNGAGQASIFFSKFYSQFTEIETINLGFVPSFFYNYGLIGVALIFYFIIKYLAKEKLLYILLFILVLLNADFNSQLFVYVVFILFSLRRFDAPNLTLKLK